MKPVIGIVLASLICLSLGTVPVRAQEKQAKPAVTVLVMDSVRSRGV
jgi:hypothetical protein